MKKKELKKEIKRLNLELEIAKTGQQDALDSYKEWRKRYELLLHTPEYKADTEAAFNRGVDMTKQKFKAWLLEGANAIEVTSES